MNPRFQLSQRHIDVITGFAGTSAKYGHVLGFKIFLHLPNSLRALSYTIEHNSNCLVADFNIERSFLISTILLLFTWLSCGELCCDPSDPLIIVGAQENTVYIDVTVEGK